MSNSSGVFACQFISSFTMLKSHGTFYFLALWAKTLHGSEKPFKGTVVQLTMRVSNSFRSTRSLNRTLVGLLGLYNHLFKVD